MNLGTRFNRNTSLALATAVALGVAAACADLTDPAKHRVGDAAPEINLDLASAGGVPRGPLAIENFKIVVDTVGQTDVFQREAADDYYSNNRYYVHTAVRIAGQDPRLPALAPVYAPEDFSTSFAYFWGPERHTEPMWDFYMRWYGLEPSVGMYTYSIERLATIVNGSLDALEYIIDGEVTEPDQLVPLDGTPGGYPDVDYTWPGSGRPGCVANPIPDPPPNPWYLGIVGANSDGRITADFCMGTPWFWYQSANVPDSSIAMLNELRRGPVPQYNYVVVYEGEAPNLGPPLIRIQIGVDLDTNGNPLPNGFAPFPVAADREAALELAHVQAAPSHTAFEIRDLEPLVSARPYEVWLWNAETGNSAPATADYYTIETVIVTDELGQQTEVDVPSADTVRTHSFLGIAESNVRHGFIVTNSTLEGVTLGEFTHVALTNPGTSGALVDPVLWGQYLDQAGTPDDPSDDIFIPLSDLKFGALDSEDPAGSRTFRESGVGDGAIWLDQLGLGFQRLRRPPPGYVYEVWLVTEAGSATSVGTITGPKPGYEDIDDADTVVHDAFMTETEILSAAKIVQLDQIDLSGYVGIKLTLEPKVGMSQIGPTLTLSGALPATGSQ
jgi:hypothetical protein